MMNDQLASEIGPRRVGICSAGVPRELLWAVGCLPVRMFPTAAKPTPAEAYLPRNFCSLTKLLLSSYLEGDAPALDAVVFTDEDDATRRLHDVWPTCVRIPVWGFLEVPRNGGPHAVSRFAGLLAALATELATHTGRPLTAARLRAAIDLYNRQRHLLVALRQRWLDGALPTPAYRRLRQMALTEAPTSANDALQEALTATDHDAADPLVASGTTSPSLRTLLLAELAAPVALVRQIEASGARIVGEVSGLDELAVNEPVPTVGDSVEALLTALAEAYLNQPPAPRLRTVSQRIAYVTHLAEQRAAHAVICAYSKFCDLYLAEYPVLRTELERVERPLLLLELEDDTLSGQHRTRVEAFLEMVRASESSH
jgi:benzoyl-CoA reductase/2-hydroxyglutaryl-CoA dehydratase subunit BcrC/BadD/HgdB